VVQPAENWAAKNVPGPLDGARDRRILLVFHVRQQYVTEMPLAEHNNMVKALPSDRTDESLSKSVLPWGTWRTTDIIRHERMSEKCHKQKKR